METLLEIKHIFDSLNKFNEFFQDISKDFNQSRNHKKTNTIYDFKQQTYFMLSENLTNISKKHEQFSLGLYSKVSNIKDHVSHFESWIENYVIN